MRDAALSFIEMEQQSADKWQHWSSSSQTLVPAGVLLDVADEGHANRRKAYRRVIKTQPITFTCLARSKENTRKTS